ncbi:hypothetical protein AAHE18_05G147400 [Arachis hypogaea]
MLFLLWFSSAAASVPAFVSMSMETANDSEMILVGDGHVRRRSAEKKPWLKWSKRT